MNKDRAVKIAFFLLRVVAGLLFFQHGSVKLLGWFGGFGGQAGATAPLMTQIGIGGVIEFFGGLAVLLGFGTRTAAFILSGQMAVAYWQFHAPNGAWPILNQGEPAVLFCFIFLFIAAMGGGDWSVDALLQRRRGAAASAGGEALQGH
jgi:putative oxidoreductase